MTGFKRSLLYFEPLIQIFITFQQKSLPHDPIKIYHYRGSFSSQKVLLYLHERGIDFTGYHVDLQRNEHLSPWYLEINPRGEVRKRSGPDGGG